MQNNNCSGHPVGGTATAQDLTQTNKILCSRFTPHRIKGFTLIELSIVLVIIGLIVGGVLTGQDLIKAATIRAQIAQMEKYNTAVHTFQLKYGYLPGDMPATAATAFGFYSGSVNGCDGSAKKRDGNGLIENAATGASFFESTGETSLFWTDLGNNATLACGVSNNQACGGAGLIDFTYAGVAPPCGGGNAISIDGSTKVNTYIPAAKLGNNNYVYVYSANGFNYFGIVKPLYNAGAMAFLMGGMPNFAITPYQGNNIDTKIDDGIATSGNVQASFANFTPIYCATTNGSACTAPPTTYAPTTALEPTTSTSCYNSDTNAYSTKLYPNNLNCALSFKFQ